MEEKVYKTFITSIRQHLMRRVKGSVSVFLYKSEKNNEYDIHCIISNSGIKFKYKVEGIQSKMLYGTSSFDVAQRFYKSYRYDVISKFFRF